jgi:hypothetical protein
MKGNNYAKLMISRTLSKSFDISSPVINPFLSSLLPELLFLCYCQWPISGTQIRNSKQSKWCFSGVSSLYPAWA